MPPKRLPAVGKKPPALARQVVETPVPSSSMSDEQTRINDEELAWCIHQLKLSLNAKKLTSKQMDAIRKDVAILENPHELLVKKRCIMKISLGDYRKKMELEKRKIPLGLENAAIATVSTSTGKFMRKSHPAVAEEKQKLNFQLPENSFRFNFDRDKKE
ncbi:UPF0488 protein CG14286-like isoform X2 [Daphnia carinata]|uniref:UPF0488 protein CG14286-like isoform X2 n=1 Tax=Daphnia carinata TaxID=120202 RepID=UPI00257D6C74|nr:UPF0488 protein CG14286-like isoform X2 [Daphnia carinata]